MKATTPGFVPWYNDDATDCPAFGLVKITGVRYDRSGRYVYTGKRVGSDLWTVGLAFNSHVGTVAGSHGSLTLWTPAIAALDVAEVGITEAARQWGPKADSWLLTYGRPGFVMIGRPTPRTSAGDIAVVTTPDYRPVICKPEGTINQGASGNALVYDTITGVGTGQRITVYSRFGDLASGVWCYAVHFNERWEAITAEC